MFEILSCSRSESKLLDRLVGMVRWSGVRGLVTLFTRAIASKQSLLAALPEWVQCTNFPVFSHRRVVCNAKVAQRDSVAGGGWAEHEQQHRREGRVPEAPEGPLGGPALPQPQVTHTHETYYTLI